MGNRKFNIPMCAAFILFILTLISMHLTSGLFARYTVTATGSDTARVAKFDVQAGVGENITMDCTLGTDPGKYSITVKNNSEVAVRYSITVDFTEQIPGTALMVTLDGESGTMSNNTLSFQNCGELVPNAEEKNHNLEFTMTNWSHVTSRENGGVRGEPNATWELDFNVTVHAEQID